MIRFTKSLLLAGIVATSSMLAMPAAFADDRDDRCGAAPRADWLSVAEISNRATALGYDVRGVEEDDGCWEVKARDRDRRKVELHFDPVSAKLIHTDHDD